MSEGDSAQLNPDGLTWGQGHGRKPAEWPWNPPRTAAVQASPACSPRGSPADSPGLQSVHKAVGPHTEEPRPILRPRQCSRWSLSRVDVMPVTSTPTGRTDAGPQSGRKEPGTLLPLRAAHPSPASPHEQPSTKAPQRHPLNSISAQTPPHPGPSPVSTF